MSSYLILMIRTKLVDEYVHKVLHVIEEKMKQDEHVQQNQVKVNIPLEVA